MQDNDIAGLNQVDPFSMRELFVSLGMAVLGVAVSIVAIQLLPVQGI